jgi:hypothetical protein
MNHTPQVAGKDLGRKCREMEKMVMSMREEVREIEAKVGARVMALMSGLKKVEGRE